MPTNEPQHFKKDRYRLSCTFRPPSHTVSAHGLRESVGLVQQLTSEVPRRLYLVGMQA